VTVEEGQSFGIEKEVVEGLSFDKGYLSPYMVTDPARMEAVYKDALILITDKKISTLQDILPVLEKVAASGRKELVIIADDVDTEALNTLVLNRLRGAFNGLAVKAPNFGEVKIEMLGDIAALTGGEVVSEKTGGKFEEVTLESLGRASKVIATKETTTIVGGKGTKKDIEARLASLKAQFAELSPKDRNAEYGNGKNLRERIAKLSGGVAVIRVGAATETEMKYLKLKIEDAVNATKAAIEEGIVPGGGVALVKAAQKITEIYNKGKDKVGQDHRVGFEVVLKALEMPLRQIALNAGVDAGVVVEKVKEAKGNGGYDAVKNEIVADMLEAGIVDPVKVTRTGLERAASAAAMLLTTEAVVADEPKEDKESPQMPEMEY